ncbi:MAG: protein translocase subunit SecD [Anaerolineae bacterium]|nr:protein translocase subunit SecD [Anaerolineae bacterium]
MNKNMLTALVAILLLTLVSLYLVLPIEHPEMVTNLLFWRPAGSRSLDFRQGLDLRGGLQVLMSADMEDDQELPPGAMKTASQIVENRVNALGLTEPVVQVRGQRKLNVELPGISDPGAAIDTIRETALLEFAEPPVGAAQQLRGGTTVSTTFGLEEGAELTSTAVGLFKTVMTGAALKDVAPGMDQHTGQWLVKFQLTADQTDFFGEYTRSHTGQLLCIILDKQILSCPQIKGAIPNGEGTISGNFSSADAQSLALQLRYGSLPIPLKIESYETIGPSLGADSVQKSLRAGIIGLSVVFLFMLVYYRLNGLAADLALALYVLLNLLLYKLLPVTMTLPGIAGFLLSTGMAVDANILVFERMKEELRGGRSLHRAIEAGFARAWTSVRDSNLATLLTCAVLWFFGDAFAASLVKGFAITLAIGTLVNVFTAIFVTRTFVRVIFHLFGEKTLEKPWLLGI